MNEPHIRYALPEDKDFWLTLDRHLNPGLFDRKVEDHTAYIISADTRPVGILRYSLFWDSIPFCNLLYIAPKEQRKGFGRALMCHWEREMAGMGYGLVLVSTQSDENAQHFYRALGYQDCGALILPFPGYEQPTELFLGKATGSCLSPSRLDDIIGS